MQDFTGTTAVITGGASGIGLATARALAREGVKLVLADSPNDEPAAAIVAAASRHSQLELLRE